MERFLKASGYLSKRIFTILKSLDGDFLKNVCEIRLRCGKPLALVSFEGTVYVTSLGRLTGIVTKDLLTVSPADIKESFSRICEYSVYSYAKDISAGFITVGGGHRAGIYGTAVYNGSNITSIRDIGGINLRISREFKNCAQNLIQQICRKELNSFIVCGAPSTGKTTLLRDSARLISDTLGKKVSIIDERGEIAAVSKGVAQNDVGINTDALDGYIKSDGIIQAVRTLSPDFIICDEIGTKADCDAVMSGINSGIKFAAAIHATSKDELKNKPDVYRLIKCGAFDKAVFLKSGVPCSINEIINAKEL